MQSVDRLPMEGFAAKQDGLTQAKVVNPTDLCATQCPLQVCRVSSRYNVYAQAQCCLDRVCKLGQHGHIPTVWRYATTACEVGTDPFEIDIRQAKCFSDGVRYVLRHDALTEVSQLNHENHAVGTTCLLRFQRELFDDLDLSVATDIGRHDDPFRLTQHW